jgi:secondary thiamine-phosphate synthase enzyme
MTWYKTTLKIQTSGKGLYPFTDQIHQQIREWGVKEGFAVLFVQHTSASMVINENYDPSAQRDMESFLEHLAPEGESWYVHTLEGDDDSPAHLRSIVTQTSLTIPIDNGKLTLGTWQGVYLAEHRKRSQQRQVLLRVMSAD